jgi:hypothetical protein
MKLKMLSIFYLCFQGFEADPPAPGLSRRKYEDHDHRRRLPRERPPGGDGFDSRLRL